MKQQKKCFTLLELGIVIVASIVIAVLLLFAIFTGVNRHASNSAREKASQSACINNLSQIGKAVFQYAISNDDWYPTSSRTSTPKWMNDRSGESLNLLFGPDRSFFGHYSDPLLPDPMVYLCPSKKGISPAQPNGSLRGHVSYNWCDGLMGDNAFLSPVACDGTDNHSDGTGRFLRGDGSVGTVAGSRTVKWTQDSAFKDFCYRKTFTDYSF